MINEKFNIEIKGLVAYDINNGELEMKDDDVSESDSGSVSEGDLEESDAPANDPEA